MPRFYGKLYPGRLNRQELYKWRAPEQYEAVMTDLCLMGILTKEQFEQYNHRYILPVLSPMQPATDPFPTLAKNYYVRDFDGVQTTGPINTVDDNSPPAGPGATEGEVVLQVQFNDGTPPQEDPPAPLGWYVQPWVWNGTAWERDTRLQPVPVQDRHWIQTTDGDDYYFQTTGTVVTTPPEVIQFQHNDFILPDVWVDLPVNDIPTTVNDVIVQQVNLQSGQIRDKVWDGGKKEHVRLDVYNFVTETVAIYNGQLPVVTPQATPPQFVLLLTPYPQDNVLYQSKTIENYPTEDDFPATGDILKLYYAEDDTTQYYYWTGAAYAPVTASVRGQAFMYPLSGWLATDLEHDLTQDYAEIINFDLAYIINNTPNIEQTPNEQVPLAHSHGIQLSQDENNGLAIEYNLPMFFDACTMNADFADGVLVNLQVWSRVRYKEK